MRAVAFVWCMVFLHGSTACQQQARIKIARITTDPVIDQDFSAWQNDDLNAMVPNLWSQFNFRYIDVRLDLESTAAISKISLYDFEGSFPENPASIYAVNGNSRTLIGNFTGDRYKEFVDLVPDTPVVANAIIIRKYANNIPQKVQVFGELIKGIGFDSVIPVPPMIRVSAPGAPTVLHAKIPLDPGRWFQLTNASRSAAALFDGDTLHKVETGWGKVLNNYDHYYPIMKGERIDLQAIRMYDGEGENDKEPFTVAVINEEGQKIVVAQFRGSEYNTWVGPDPEHPGNFQLPASFENIQYILLNSNNFFPNEIEFIGNYTPAPGYTPSPAVTSIQRPAVPLRQMFGVNGFEWNFELPSAPGQIDAASFAVAKTFTGFRHYMDWEKLESTRGNYSYNPTLSGGWNYDALYDSCRAAGIEVLACLKTLPPWMINTYPPAERDNENIPMIYGKDPSLPASYLEQAMLGFQFAARYGKNTAIDPALIKVNTQPRWFGDKVNEKKTGLGTVSYIECENERDKWWKGRKAYQTAFEYAANLSAFYDGNNNTMGPGVGVKNADPGMLVVMAGTALASTDYLKGMIDWCRRYRGYRADGSVNLCWDIINYHYYSNDSQSSQNGQATRGAAPENSGARELAAEFIKIASTIGNNLPVWVTELGYDANQGSAFKAIPVADKSAVRTQADWILRSSLLYARTGVERIFFYGMYDDNLNSALQFSSSGLINQNKTRKPAADFISQVNRRFGNYSFANTKSNNPVVDEYRNGAEQMFMLVMPSENGSSASYELEVPGYAYATIYTPVVGAEQMQATTKPLADGKLKILVTETPVFVVPAQGDVNTLTRATAATKLAAIAEEKRLLLEKSVQVYPNPAFNELKLLISNTKHEPVSIRIYEAASGKIFTRISVQKQNQPISRTVDISKLSAGYFIVEIRQGKTTVSRKILKQSRY